MNVARFLKSLVWVFLLSMIAGTNVNAVPVLQLYVEGSSYDTEHESWVFDAILGETFTLWVIGNIDGPGGAGPISNVKLAAVYPDPIANDGGSLTISLTASTTGGFGGFTDTSVPIAPIGPDIISEAGDSPSLTGGKLLAPHGVYVQGSEWQQFQLGNLDTPDSPIADFIYSFPVAGTELNGQINAYDVVVTANDPTLTGPFDVHFDAYDGVMSGNHFKAKFAPFSHDAGTGINDRQVPEPAALALLGLGLVGLAFSKRT